MYVLLYNKLMINNIDLLPLKKIIISRHWICNLVPRVIFPLVGTVFCLFELLVLFAFISVNPS